MVSCEDVGGNQGERLRDGSGEGFAVGDPGKFTGVKCTRTWGALSGLEGIVGLSGRENVVYNLTNWHSEINTKQCIL